MRIPRNKLHRAFREFDSFDDAACKRHLWMMARLGLLHRWAPPLVGVVVLVVQTILIPVVMVAFEPWIAPLMAWADRIVINHGFLGVELLLGDLFLVVVLTLLWLGVPILAGLLFRDMLIWRALRKRVSLARCGACHHSLIGLPVDESEGKPSVRCPECGELWALEKLGLTAEDLSPAASA